MTNLFILFLWTSWPALMMLLALFVKNLWTAHQKKRRHIWKRWQILWEKGFKNDS